MVAKDNTACNVYICMPIYISEREREVSWLESVIGCPTYYPSPSRLSLQTMIGNSDWL